MNSELNINFALYMNSELNILVFWEINFVFSVAAMVHTAYVDTSAGFTITCNFVGEETPTDVVWKRTPTSTAQETLTSATTDFTVDNSVITAATLVKASTVAGDAGMYTCEFQFAEGTKPSATGNVKIRCK